MTSLVSFLPGFLETKMSNILRNFTASFLLSSVNLTIFMILLLPLLFINNATSPCTDSLRLDALRVVDSEVLGKRGTLSTKCIDSAGRDASTTSFSCSISSKTCKYISIFYFLVPRKVFHTHSKRRIHQASDLSVTFIRFQKKDIFWYWYW